MLRFASSLVLVLCFAAPAFAQRKEPIQLFVVDVRGAFGRHKAEPSVATELEVEPGNLPTRTLGLAAGVHVYPLHAGSITFGFGGNMVMTSASRSLDVQDASGNITQSPTVRRHFTTFSPEISLNFGHRSGWSYISGGMFGGSKLYLDREDNPATFTPYRKTVNYGGGARWFTNDHVAFSVDFRWYSVDEQIATTGTVSQPRTTLLILSGGISLK